MNKLAQGLLARAGHFERLGDFEKSIEAYKQCTELPNVWRSLALAYADIDELEKSLESFEKAVDSGDIKSLPWLVELLEMHRPDDSRLPRMKKQIEDGLSAGDIDVVFSVGNIQMAAGEYLTAFEIWSDYILQEHWIINRNIANVLLTRYLQFGELMPPPLGPITTEDAAIDFLIHVNEKHFKEGNTLGLVEIGMAFLSSPELEQFKDFTPLEFFDSFIEAAKAGHGEAMLLALYFATTFPDDIKDDRELIKLLEEFGMSDFTGIVGYKVAPDNLAAQYGATYSSNNAGTNVNDPIQAIFDRANQASKNGDSLGEVAAWIEGVNLGDENCFHNLGVALCRELGIVQNFWGSQGGEGHAWSPLAMGIGAAENRPGRGPLQQLSRFLSSTQIAQVRSTYGGRPSEEPESLKPGQAESLVKICDLFEKCGYIYTVLDQNLIAIPYRSEFGGYIMLCELIDDDGKDMALIYTCLLTSKFDEEGNPISKQSGLNTIQEKVLEILIREQELVFPSMMLNIGDIFNSLPPSSAPMSFVNISKAREYWSVIGATAASMFFEALPTKHEFEKFEFGYGIDVSLQSDHFEAGIRGVVGSITGILERVSSMHEESEELFELIFDYQPSTSFNYGANLVPYSELGPKGSRTARLVTVFEEKKQEIRLETLVELANSGMHVARRAMLDAVEFTKDNIDTIAYWMMKESELDENHPQIRDYLNSVGWAYMGFGDAKKAMPFFEKAANLGSGNALANLSWHLLKTGEHERARKVFDESYYRIMTTRETENDFEQGSNIRSNDALHRFALGASHDELRSIWCDAHFQEDNLESKFYPILLDHLEGKTKVVQAGLEKLTEQNKKDLVEIFKELVSEDNWISGIAQTSLELLPEEPQKKKGLFRR
jgi:tetratricopeptide (TPR) repeat protein